MAIKRSAEGVASSVILLRDSYPGPSVIVEGPTDRRLLGKFVSLELGFVLSGGKPFIRPALDILSARGITDVLGVVDRDLELVFGRLDHPDEVCWDYQDLETMLLRSPALDALAASTCSEGKLAAFLEMCQADNLTEALMRRCTAIGGVRAVSHREGLDLPFANVSVADYADRRTLEIDVRRVAASLLQKRYGSQGGLNGLLSAARRFVGESAEPLNLVRGHDAVELFAYGMRSAIGSYDAEAPSADFVAGTLVAAFTRDDFQATSVYRDIVAWEQAKGVRLIRD